MSKNLEAVIREAKAVALEEAADARMVDKATGVELFALGLKTRQWLRARAAAERKIVDGTV